MSIFTKNPNRIQKKIFWGGVGDGWVGGGLELVNILL